MELEEAESGWGQIRVPKVLVEEVDRAVEGCRDEFGMPRYRSRTEFATVALKKMLRRVKK